MRSVLSSGWTVLVLLLAGTYLLGFAGTAMADEWPGSSGANNGSSWLDERACKYTAGMGGGSCTNYSSTCSLKANDPNLSGTCPGYDSVTLLRFRIYGTWQPHNCGPFGCTCTWWTTFYCAELKFYYNSDCTNPPGTDPCYCYVVISGACAQPINAPPPPSL